MKWFLALMVVTIVSSGCGCGPVELYSCDYSETEKLEVHGKVTFRGEPVSGVVVWLQGVVPATSPTPKRFAETSSTGNYRVWATYNVGGCRDGFHGLNITLPDPPRESVTIDLGKGCKNRTVNHDFK